MEAFLAAHETVFVVEQNRDAQLRSLLVLETPAPKEKLRSILAFGGFPLQASQVVAGVKKGQAGAKVNGSLGSRWGASPAQSPRPLASVEHSVQLGIKKPVAQHPSQKANAIGLTVRDYEGSMSTLCAGCGHDSITAAIVRAFYELDTPPHMVAKLSGIGCSSKTPTYFLSGAHGFNSAHGRMPAIVTGANAANKSLTYIGVSGDGDSLSIGLGQMAHAIRRNVDMLYVVENNGVYGLTKGQFSASADVGSKSKKGEANQQAAHPDPAM